MNHYADAGQSTQLSAMESQQNPSYGYVTSRPAFAINI
jgi:hypothetical protein